MDFVLASGNGWEGLYLNGYLVIENHQLTANQVLRTMDGYRLHDRLHYEHLQVNEEWLARRGSLPMRLNEVKFG